MASDPEMWPGMVYYRSVIGFAEPGRRQTDTVSPGDSPSDAGSAVAELFGAVPSGVWRQIRVESRPGPRLLMPAVPRGYSTDTLRQAWDRAWLHGKTPVTLVDRHRFAGERVLRVVDLFAGCGAMSLGVKMAAESVGMSFASMMCADACQAAVDVYRHNLAPKRVFSRDLRDAIEFRLSGDGSFAAEPRLRAPDFAALRGAVDVLIGGPPCQGHSDLNNHSRRDDPKNSLYLLMPAFARVLSPKIVIIENVPSVVHDIHRVVEKSAKLLRAANYEVATAVIALDRIGVAQRRRRHLLVAVRGRRAELADVESIFGSRPRSVGWVIGDLLATTECATPTVFDTPSRSSPANLRRMKWLFRNKTFNLPNRLRPSCHRDEEHSYKSKYGRMDWNAPAQTITTGFGSPGQGRYIHPRRVRTLTPHEAARIQFFPDSFSFRLPAGELRRTEIAEMIGNAVPPKLAYVVALLAIAAAYEESLCAKPRR